MAAYETVVWQPLKKCPDCDTEKSLDDFGTDNSRKDGKYPYCKECVGRRQREYRERDAVAYKARNLKSNLKKRYRLSVDGFYSLIESQDGMCANPACCSVEQLVIDHDHSCCPQYVNTCGKCIRGVLCNRCNTALGNVGDDVDMLMGLVRYLKGEA